MTQAPKKLSRLLLFACIAVAASVTHAAAVPGQPAPAFQGAGIDGKPVSLADFRGKTVVIEWNNPHCPFVMKHYSSGNMQALQRKAAGTGVVWLTVNSTADSHSEYMPPARLASWMGEQKAAPTAVVMDPKGDIARAYGARVTPHMFVIDSNGKIAYAGAIDDKRSTNPADIKTSNNHVVAALTDLAAGRPVATTATTAYGCSIKYP
jgi:peroxiredoxin